MIKHKMIKIRKIFSAFVAALLLLSFSACSMLGGIREDSVREGIPLIDPESGLTTDVAVNLYYRLSGEEYLVGLMRNVSVRPNERVEAALVRTLLEGLPESEKGVSTLIPAGTQLLEASIDGGVMHVTLSEEFFTNFHETAAWTEGYAAYEKGDIDDAQFEAMVSAGEEEDLRCRRLGVYSIVNTVTDYNPNVRVLIWVYTEARGTGRIPRSELGMKSAEDADVDELEAMAFETSLVANPETIVTCALDRVIAADFAAAYKLFALTGANGVVLAEYPVFEAAMLALDTLKSYEISTYEADNTAQGILLMTLTVSFENRSGQLSTYRNKLLVMKFEDGFYRIDYASLMGILEGEA